jgi:hypothetical protein
MMLLLVTTKLFFYISSSFYQRHSEDIASRKDQRGEDDTYSLFQSKFVPT